VKTLLGVLSIAALLVVSNVSAQDTTAQADTILDVNKPSVGNDAFKNWQRPKALNNDSLMALGRGQSGPERSYNATKELVWNAVVETLSDLRIAVKKADKNKGDIQSESEPRASEYFSCELHDKRGRPPQEGFWVKGPRGNWLRQSRNSRAARLPCGYSWRELRKRWGSAATLAEWSVSRPASWRTPCFSG